MKERSALVTYLRGEIVGPSRPLLAAEVVEIHSRVFTDPNPARRGALAWRPAPGAEIEEILYYDRESPHRKYGAGLLHPEGKRAIPPEEEDGREGDLTHLVRGVSIPGRDRGTLRSGPGTC